MKHLFLICIFPFSCYSQELRENYIVSNNFASEAEYYFHEHAYDSAAFYFEKAFELINEAHPMQRYKYAKALWKLKKFDSALNYVVESGMWEIDTNWFTGLSSDKYKQINAELRRKSKLNDSIKNCSFYSDFVDSISKIDQYYRQIAYTTDSIKWLTIKYYDSCNASALIQFTRKHGFPAGVNSCWSQKAGTILLHMSPEWFIENYALLYYEVEKGNLEPWMLARGIDRMFTIEVGDDKINPYNRYWKESTINPFLMFYNCVALGVSPYYDFNWSSQPQKTIHFDYYKGHKRYFNTAFAHMKGGKRNK